MRGSSQTSLDQAKAILDSDFAAPTLAQQLSSTLFGLLDALDSAPALGRLLANPNRPVAAKTGVIKQILAEQSPAVVGFAEHLVRARWSHDADLAEAVEQLAVAASLNVITSNDGSLMAFEQAVFDFDRLCAAHCPLRLALADPQAPPAAGRQLVEQLSGLTGVSLSLLQRAVLQRRGRSLAASLLHLGQTTAARRGRLIAQVTAGQPLRDNQLKRLEEL
ncbi:MAG: F0F1 ATP synthase subunit delta, partial [Bifidobacteriaceae bacterium]|nr:F0F1 ATP synthase subunit delta [Bifidobacteriaceae bacterium]